MSVLARLALKALGAPSAVRPRLGGLFESPSIAADAPEAAAPAPGGLMAVSIPMLDVAAPRPAQTGEAGPTAARFAPRASELDAEAPSWRRPQSAQDEPGDPQRSASTRPHDPAEAAGERTIVREIVQGVGVPPPAASSAAYSHEPAPRPETAAPFAPAPEPPRAAEPYRPLLPPLRDPPRAPAALPQIPAQATAEPDLHISIGRIEVRGEPEARRPAASPRGGGAKLMSLEDYLAKGRRR